MRKAVQSVSPFIPSPSLLTQREMERYHRRNADGETTTNSNEQHSNNTSIGSSIFRLSIFTRLPVISHTNVLLTVSQSVRLRQDPTLFRSERESGDITRHSSSNTIGVTSVRQQHTIHSMRLFTASIQSDIRRVYGGTASREDSNNE